MRFARLTPHHAGLSLPYVGPTAEDQHYLAGAAHRLANGPEDGGREPGAAQRPRAGAGPSPDDAKGAFVDVARQLQLRRKLCISNTVQYAAIVLQFPLSDFKL